MLAQLGGGGGAVSKKSRSQQLAVQRILDGRKMFCHQTWLSSRTAARGDCGISAFGKERAKFCGQCPLAWLDFDVSPALEAGVPSTRALLWLSSSASDYCQIYSCPVRQTYFQFILITEQECICCSMLHKENTATHLSGSFSFKGIMLHPWVPFVLLCL